MTKVKILALLVGMVLLFTLPAIVSAQNVRPHVFVGTAWIDHAAVPEGTTISAWVGGVEAGSTTTTDDGGTYSILVGQGETSLAGQTITFLIDGLSASQSATWMEGGGDELTLSASSAMAGEVVTLDLGELNASGQSGTATLTEMGDKTLVELTLSAGALQTELVHIHSGQCGDTLGGVVYDLDSFVGGSGTSTTTVDATLAKIQDGNHAINSHDASDASIYTACVNIPGGAMAMEPTPMAMAPAPTGVPGARGSAGPSGADGAKGDTGPAGSAGSGGSAGAQGDTGPAGSAGATGDAGASGSTGPAGATGAGGAAGDDGSSGALAIVGLILAIIALVGVGGVIVLGRRT